MNLRILLRMLGIIVMVIGAAMVFPLAWAVYFRVTEDANDYQAFLISMAISLGVGALLVVCGKTPADAVQRRESVAVVGLGWLLAAAVGALPFYFSGTVSNVVDAYFEAMSGFTTTGSTILDDIEGAPKGILFWRSFTQWLGGMGIIVLFVAILPFLKATGKQLLYNEVPGPTSENLQPRIRDTAVTLWVLYLVLSGLLTILLWLEGMPIYEAMCHTCSTMSTGGFSPNAASIGHYASEGNGLLIELTIIVFMVLAGTNFGLYYWTLKGQWKTIFKDAEWRFYLFLIALATGAIVFDLWFYADRPVGEALRTASFQTVSLMTTTGFGTEDFDTWPSLSKILLVVLFFVGGCAGSTGGGMKVVRILVLIKNALIATEHAFRPRTVRTLRVGGTVVESETRERILAYFSIVMGTMVLSSLLLAGLGMDPVSAVTAAATTLNNIGPGLEAIGASESFSSVPAAGKVLLSLLMVVGRLEVFAIMVLLAPSLWRAH